MKFWVRAILSVAALVLLVGCGGKGEEEIGGMKIGETTENEFEKITFSDFFFCDEYDGVDEGVEANVKETFEAKCALIGIKINELEKKDGCKWLVVIGNYVNNREKNNDLSSFVAEVKLDSSDTVKGEFYRKHPAGIINSTQLKLGMFGLEKGEDGDFVAAFCVPEKVAKKWKRGTIKIGIDSDDAKMVTLPPDKLERCYKLTIEH